jgi:alpha-galactosidase
MTNRVNTTDLRLLCGQTAVHSDMFMWNNDDLPESAALQLINILFTVPQVSVLIDTLPKAHMEMLRFWLQFWREHRDVLLDGEFAPQSPELLYPVVIASNAKKRIVAVYADAVAPIEADVPDELIVVNGTRRHRVVVDLSESLHERHAEVLDCRGWLVHKGPIRHDVGVHAFDVPSAGLIRITANR